MFKYRNKRKAEQNLLYVGLSVHFTVFNSSPLNHCLNLLRLLEKNLNKKIYNVMIIQHIEDSVLSCFLTFSHSLQNRTRPIHPGTLVI